MPTSVQTRETNGHSNCNWVQPDEKAVVIFCLLTFNRDSIERFVGRCNEAVGTKSPFEGMRLSKHEWICRAIAQEFASWSSE